jgi:glutamine cyclotransferase
MVIALTYRPASSAPIRYTYEVVNTYPHDRNAFTQGLVFDGGVFYESTGIYGQSSLRCVELETGEIIQFQALQSQYFAEGITILGDKIIQLTWQSRIGFVYDKHSFDLLQEFNYSTEGWGITYDGSKLIMSDGTATLYFLDPKSFENIGQVEVRDNGSLVSKLNELEYVRGEIYANIWCEEKIAAIDPQTGQVKGWIDLSGIKDPADQDSQKVSNGIAYDVEADRLFVTGKMWSKVFEIKLLPSL